MQHSRDAIEIAQNKIFDVIDKWLIIYYLEYDPIEYERTRQFLHSLVRSDIQGSGDGWTATVYFDYSALQYKKGWSGAATMQTAAVGSHGGLPAIGSGVWNAPKKELTPKRKSLLKSALLAAGIPVK